jgi:hypothetical protein
LPLEGFNWSTPRTASCPDSLHRLICVALLYVTLKKCNSLFFPVWIINYLCNSNTNPCALHVVGIY